MAWFSRKTRILLSIALFVMLAGGFLGIVLTAAWKYYRRPPSSLQQAIGGSPMMQQRQNQPWWKRWLQLDRRLPTTPRARGRTGKQSDAEVEDVVPAFPGATGNELSPDHLAMRELAEAQIIRFNQREISEDEAISIVDSAPIQGRFRTFEEQRFASRLLLSKHLVNRHDRQLLGRFHQAAVKAAESPYASFEEWFYAGYACLFTGDIESAATYTQKALDSWPARGNAYGNVYLLTMTCHAINGEASKLFRMLLEFQDHYPDWMYVETYMPDLEDLEGIYPEAPLLDVIRGYCYGLVLNHAAARREYQQALDSPRMGWLAQGMVEQWMEQMEEGDLP